MSRCSSSLSSLPARSVRTSYIFLDAMAYFHLGWSVLFPWSVHHTYAAISAGSICLCDKHNMLPAGMSFRCDCDNRVCNLDIARHHNLSWLIVPSCHTHTCSFWSTCLRVQFYVWPRGISTCSWVRRSLPL